LIETQGIGLYDVNDSAVGATFYISMAIEQKIPGFMAHYGSGY